MDDHQAGNARVLSDVGASILLPESDFTIDRLSNELQKLFLDQAKLAKMASLTRDRVKLNAGARLAELTCALVNEEKS